MLARLQHPHIAHLLDAGVTAGQPYLVLEYIEGEPIDRWCDMYALDIASRIRLFVQVLAAVSHAHGKLILHRDLKPSRRFFSRRRSNRQRDDRPLRWFARHCRICWRTWAPRTR